MLMGIDVGNTNIKIGIIDTDKNGEFNLITGFRLTTKENLTSDELGIRVKTLLRDNSHRINPYKMDAIICSSVVPKLNHTISNMSVRYLGHIPYFINADSNLNMKISYEKPEEIGADRLVNAVAVNEIYKAPAIIIDFGTATTFCALSCDRGYLGGLIVPGVLISLDALSSKTAKLPQVELVHPQKSICSSTKEAISTGSYYSTIGTVEKICTLLKDEMGESDIKVVATGGVANFISKGTKMIDIVDPLLILKGMLQLYTLNKGNFKSKIDDNDFV